MFVQSVKRGYPGFLLFLMIMLSLGSDELSAQTFSSQNKTGTNEITVNVVDISKQSSEAIMEARQIKDRLIRPEELNRKKREIDSLVLDIDKQIQAEKKNGLTALGMRKLKTNLISVEQQKSLVIGKKKEMENLLNNLVENKNMLMSSLTYWKKAKEVVRKKRLGKTVENSVNEVIITLNKTLYTINKLTNTTIRLIRELSALELELDARISLINKLLQKKQGEILSEKQPSFFALDFSDAKKYDLTQPIKQFKQIYLRTLGHYLSLNIETVIIHIILVIVLIVFFIRLSREPIPLEEPGVRYKKNLNHLLSQPISTALIIGIFASVIIYTNRPLIFRDLVILFIIVPITILLKNIFRPRFHFSVYAIALILFSILLYSYVPVTNIFSRLLLLFISLIELFSSIYFVVIFRHEAESKKRFGKFFLALGYLGAFFILVGFIANIVGKVMLAKYLLFSIAEIVLVIFIIMITAAMINGILITYVTRKGSEQSNFIRKNRYELIKKLPRFVNFVAFVILLHYVLMILGWEKSFIDALATWLGHDYKLGSITFSWGRFFIFLFIIWFSIFIGRIVRDVLEEDVLNKVKMEEGLPHTIAMMARYTLITLGVLLAFSALGMPMSDLAIMFSAFGVGIGFGLQNIFNNLVSGFILLFERPIKIGDTIEVGDLIGTVRSIGIRASNIRTFDGAEIIVPNGNLISNEVVNWTLSDQRRRIEIMVNVAYHSDPQKVKQVLLQLLEKHDDVAKDPKPGIYFVEMGNSALVFRVLFWTHQYGKWYSIRSNMMYDIFQTLKEAGIEIPFNQLDVHLRPQNAEDSSL